MVLAARFERAFWKYRNHSKALAALLMDAAHLSQTLYLVATELGLGASSLLLNNGDIEEQLGIDGYREGVLAVCRVGRPAAEASPSIRCFGPSRCGRRPCIQTRPKGLRRPVARQRFGCR